MNVARGRALVPGDVVAIVSPSGPPKPEATDAGLALLERAGYQVQVPPTLYDRHGYLAGDDQSRAAELNRAFRDDNVRAIFCARGGYGVSRMVDLVDFDAAMHDPKPVVGYSDITALHLALAQHGVAGIHGPVLTTFSQGHSDVTAQAWSSAFTSTDDVVVTATDSTESHVLTSGTEAVEGPLLGGNLSLIVDAVGTRTCPNFDGTIMFWEEINEEPYRLDRILTQLSRSGVLNGIVGIALGQFTECVDDGSWDWDVIDVLRDRLKLWDVPVVGGFALGHGPDPLTVPYGTTARLDPCTRTLSVEAAVTS